MALDSIDLFKRELAQKINGYESKLKELRESREKSAQLSRRMAQMLDNLAERANHLEMAILPRTQTTELLQRKLQNAGDVLKELSAIEVNYSIGEQVKPIIHAGPTPSDLPIYMHQLEKLLQAEMFFRSQGQKNDADQLNDLLDAGREKMLSYYKQILVQYKTHVTPAMLQDDEQVELLPSTAHDQLALIGEWFNKLGDHRYLATFVEERGSAMLSLAEKLAASKSDFMGRRGDSGRNSGRTWSRKGLSSASKTKVDDALLTVEELYEQFVNVLFAYRLFELELQLADTLIPKKRLSRSFESTWKRTMEFVNSKGASLAEAINTKRNFLSAIFLLRAVSLLDETRPKFLRALTGADVSSSPLGKLDESRAYLESHVSQNLQALLTQLRSGETTFPPDGTVSQVTTEVTGFLEKLAEHTDVLGRLDNKIAGTRITPIMKRTALFNSCRMFLENLGLRLQKISEGAANPYLAHLFLLNNYNYIIHTMTEMSLFEALEDSGEQLRGQLQTKLETEMSRYLECAAPVVSMLTFVPAGKTKEKDGRMGNKEKLMIKEKFVGFNAQMESLLNSQKKVTVRDVALKNQLKRELYLKIKAPYVRFLDKYATSGFAKNTGKYMTIPHNFWEYMEPLYNGGEGFKLHPEPSLPPSE